MLPAYPGYTDKEAIKWVSVCLYAELLLVCTLLFNVSGELDYRKMLVPYLMWENYNPLIMSL